MASCSIFSSLIFTSLEEVGLCFPFATFFLIHPRSPLHCGVQLVTLHIKPWWWAGFLEGLLP